VWVRNFELSIFHSKYQTHGATSFEVKGSLVYEHYSLEMKRGKYLVSGILVLCHFMLNGSLLAQQVDSSKAIVFNPNKNAVSAEPIASRLEGVANLGVGSFSGFKLDGHYASFLQPTIGFEFLAEPGDGLHLLFGGHLGISNPITAGFSFGIRAPLNITNNLEVKCFTDLGILFFDDAGFAHDIKYGARIAFGARTIGAIDFEYRLAGEWRGAASDSIDSYRKRQLWWVGAEIGIAFSLVSDTKPFTLKDSLRASLHYIATSEEMDELEAITSDAKLDNWLEHFWRVRDLTPDTKLNEARIEYEKRVEAANRMFSTPRRLGILTDPGRVFALYGVPNVNETDHAENDNRIQYMLYVYSGRIRDVSFGTFLFSTSNSRSGWEQIYSNVPGELSGRVPGTLPPRFYQWIQ